MEIKTKKYDEYLKFIEDLKTNQPILIEQLATAEDKVLRLRQEKSNGELLDTRPCKEDPPKLIELKKRAADNLVLVKHSLTVAEKEYADLLEQNKPQDPAPVAEQALLEADEEIRRMEAEFGNVINVALMQRKYYLQSLLAVRDAMQNGRGLVDRTNGVQTFLGSVDIGGKRARLQPHSNFTTTIPQFEVTIQTVRDIIVKGKG